MTYYTTLTNVGEAKLANAFALGVPLPITHMAVGDGAGATPEPDKNQQQLVNEVRRAQLNSLGTDAANPSALLAEQVIPAEVGGWWIREMGLFDRDGDLIAVCNCPPTYKPLLTEGSGRTQILRMLIAVSSIDSVELKVDPSVVLATREYVDNALMASSIAVSIEGPTTVYAGSSNHYKITNYHSFSSYEVATNSGEISINGENITLLLSDTDTASPARIRVIRDGQINVFDITVMEKSIAQPEILTPVHESEEVNRPIIISSSPYLAYPAGTSSHSKSHWKLTRDIFGEEILWQAFSEKDNLTEIIVDSNETHSNTTYYAHVRYYSPDIGYSEWSLPSKFTTAESKTLEPGDLYEGGIAIGIHNGHYIIVAPAAQRGIRKWGLHGIDTILPNNPDPDPNTSEYNTDILISDQYRGIIDQDGQRGSPAAEFARSKGYDLPNRETLKLIFDNKEAIDEFDVSDSPTTTLDYISSGNYFAISSTESSATQAIAVNFASGNISNRLKTLNAYILPVRSIPI